MYVHHARLPSGSKLIVVLPFILVRALQLAEEKAEYEAAVAAGPAVPPGTEPALDCHVRLVHGDEVIADSAESGLAGAVTKFKAWVRSKYYAGSA